jgi:hypothetical protein
MTVAGTTLRIDARYTRSINLLRDFEQQHIGLDGYQATPLVVQTIERIVGGLSSDARTRAFSLIGPYGSGKSAFGVFLAHLLGSEYTKRRQLLKNHSSNTLTSYADIQAPTLMPVLVSGNNSSLRFAIVQSLQRVLEHLRLPINTNTELHTKLTHALSITDLDPQQVADLVQQTAQVIRHASPYSGLLVLIDELGQFLDYAVHQKSERDLFVLQTLAEMASRSGETPVLLVTILHQAFEHYTATAGQSRRLELAKVQGRFIDLPFQEPSSEMIRMIGRALCPDRRALRQRERQNWIDRVGNLSDQLGLRPADISIDEWNDLVGQTYPLHPTVLIALPTLFRQLAQNERSLFAFLTTNEPWSLLDVITNSAVLNTQTTPIYRLPHLFAYAESALGPGLFGRARGQRWAELAESRSRLPELEPPALEVLTTIGTLGALGQQRSLRASLAQISFALTDCVNDEAVTNAISILAHRTQIVYRKYRDSYVLWEGSDLNLEALAQTARQRMADQLSLVQMLQQHANPLPLIARAHSYRSGTTRHMVYRFVDATTLSQDQAHPADADGELVVVVPNDDEVLDLARSWATHPERRNEPWRIVIIPEQVQDLRDLLLDVAALRYILEHQPELEHDGIARRELTSQLSEAEQKLDKAIDKTFGPGASCWYWRGKMVPVKTDRQRDALLSAACDETYYLSPRIWNELIVRRQPSAAAAKARRNLIEAMLDHADEPALGLQGYPPERAIYESVLHISGIHRQQNDELWHFGPPSNDDSLHMLPTWNCIQSFFDSTATRSRPLIELYAQLAAPPFGIKDGLIPLLVMSAYLANVGELAIYEHGNYVPVPDIAVFERMLRQPSYFAVRQSRATGVRIAVYERLARALAPKAFEKQGQAALLDAITPLLRFVARLPGYARTTRSLSSRAQAVRQALIEARAPDELLFEHLPLACNLQPFNSETDGEQIEQFFVALRTSLEEMQNVYPTLVSIVAKQIRVAFGAEAERPDALREELSERYRRIAAVTSDTAIRAFGVRLENAGPDEAWIESIGALVGRKPLDAWQDNDGTQFSIQISDLGRRFRLVEQVAVVQQMLPPETPVLRVGVADASEERSVVVSTRVHNTGVQIVRKSVITSLENNGIVSREQQIAALAETLRFLLDGTPEESHHD